VAQVRDYPFPTQLTAAATGARIAWALDERGRRNVWVAEGPEFAPRRVTAYDQDDGQEITSLAISADGRYVVYVRGGDHGSNWDVSVGVNAVATPVPPRVQMWLVPFAGGAPRLVSEGDHPALSPACDRVAFLKDEHVWLAPLDGSSEPRRIIAVRGEAGSLQWSPDGKRLAFVSGRGDHAFVGVYTSDAEPIVWLAPSTSRDGSPRWSPDGTRIAFIRRPGEGGVPDPLLVPPPQRWAIWTADATTGAGRELWSAPATARGSLPTTHGGTNLHWAAGGRIAYLSYSDGWPHLYSIAEGGGEPRLLTPGPYMVEHVSLTPDRRALLFAANTGPDADDIDRRHVARVPVDRAEPKVLTPGTGLEWSPVATGDGAHVAFLGASAQRPPLPTVLPAAGGTERTLALDRLAPAFPAAALVTPRKVVYRAPDGVEVHAQLFARDAPPGTRRPAVIYVHGGPPRQMLLGWHYSDYYANAYAVNQALAARGFVVLSVNFRLGIGYGHAFHFPEKAGWRGAAEYQDVKAAAEWLRARPDVDPARIGIWGGSYGGYLTALALARDSGLFAAGVDIHGVHDWASRLMATTFAETRHQKAADLPLARDTAWRSSPVADVATWRSPVLLIHADDDRNVRFDQTVDLARRLAAAGVPFEEIVIPDDTHHFMRHAHQLRVNEATVEFLARRLGMR
jgi:dipeptidyl aminopeptidase/acylaminoacyl peptidase